LGRKVHPYGFRLGIIKDHRSRWIAQGREYVRYLEEDRAIRQAVAEEAPNAGISWVEIERQPGQVRVVINTAKPGIVIGRKGVHVNRLRTRLQELTGKKVKVDVNEIQRPETDAQLVAESIAEQLTRRISWKRAMKRAAQQAMRAGAQGIMITVSGRLGGAEMGRVDSLREGQVPRHTLRADIDYGTAEALTTYGVIGVKVWINHGEVLPGEEFHAKYSQAA